jgi:hypothetical protein
VSDAGYAVILTLLPEAITKLQAGFFPRLH